MTLKKQGIMFNILTGILNIVLGTPIDLTNDEICKFTSILKKNGLNLHTCDPYERPMAIITAEGTWEHETDNSQGSLKIRFDIFASY